MIIKKVKIILALFVAFSIFVPNVYGYFTYNKSCEAFPEQCEGTGGDKSATLSIGQLIIEAAGTFIKSNSDYQLFLREFEISGTYGADYEALKVILNSAIQNMEAANSLYHQIWQASLTLEYNPVVIQELRSFNYAAYQAEKPLLPSIFHQVSELLKSGNVRGTYERAVHATGEILEKLGNIKADLEDRTPPKIPDCWRLNQLYFETELFGQYVSEIFYAI